MGQRHPSAAVAISIGSDLIDRGRPEQALASLSEAARRFPDNAAIVHLIGLALTRLGLIEPAAGAFYHALTLNPFQAASHANLAAALVRNGGTREARRHAKLAYELEPTASQAATLSFALVEDNAFAEALAFTDEAIACGQASAELLVNRSIALEDLGRPDEAIAAARHALTNSTAAPIAHHLAALLLSQGHLTAEAWALYESRFGLNARAWPRSALRWDGQDVAGKTVLLHAEQGLGDTLQFVRYVPLVAARGASVILVVQPTLKRLLNDTRGLGQIASVGDALPRFDLFCPLLSLPRIFATTLETIPAPIAYDLPPVGRPAGRLRVGVAWAGGSSFIEDHKRSVRPEWLCRLADIEGVDLFSLQLPGSALPSQVTELLGNVTDMFDTARQVASLDLVVTVDTAVAHLAATMGKTVWLLSRFRGCWRWLKGRSDSPWYPSMTIYRQTHPGDWQPVLANIRADLARLAALRAGEPDACQRALGAC